ncbi:type II toxin-antitoxin system YafQ family toxin [Pedobacter sp.]|uniref:type II toxin-antitoxin system RelE/ParE family toxin n=1 Tax=Pedobacter sp. TaxID=1411316 RepID=UPI0035BF8924
MYTIDYTNKFIKDLKLVKKRSTKDFALVANFIENELALKGASGLDKKYKAHKLSGNYKDNWECHINR